MFRAECCPLGYNNLQCDLPDNHCRNFSFCRLQTASWEIPYTYENNVLTVKEIGSCFHSSPIDIDNTIFNEQTKLYDVYFYLENNPIRTAWQLAGWYEAQELPESYDTNS